MDEIASTLDRADRKERDRPYPRSRRQKSASLRNLARRPARPAAGNGHVQRLRQRRANHDNRAARRALDRIAVRIGRARTIGRPVLWRLRERNMRAT